MTDLDLDAIEARANSARPGPWRLGIGGVVVVHAQAKPTDYVEAHCAPGGNAAFIAAARTDVPLLVAEVRRLREENAAIQAALDSLNEWCDGKMNEPAVLAEKAHLESRAWRETKYLKDHISELKLERSLEITKARDEERRRIVAWLRKQPGGWDYAGVIDDGEHLKETER
jgi:hypothetical protein